MVRPGRCVDPESLPPDLTRRFWVVMDEIASLQELPALTPVGWLLTMSRKHGGATILGLQDTDSCGGFMGSAVPRASPDRASPA